MGTVGEHALGVPSTTDDTTVLEPFESFYRRQYRPVLGLALVLGTDRTAAEDATQDAFLAAEHSWNKVGRLDKPEAWIRKVVANKSVSWFRHRTAETRALTRLARTRPNPPIGDDPEFTAATREVWDTVRTLPRRQAIAIALTYLDDWTPDQIGEVLGCSPGTVKTHLRRGKANLATRLGVEVTT